MAAALSLAAGCSLAGPALGARAVRRPTLKARIDASVDRPAFALRALGHRGAQPAHGPGALRAQRARRTSSPPRPEARHHRGRARRVRSRRALAHDASRRAGRLDALGRILGDVYLVGRGDPNLSGRFSDGRASAAFEELADGCGRRASGASRAGWSATRARSGRPARRATGAGRTSSGATAPRSRRCPSTTTACDLHGRARRARRAIPLRGRARVPPRPTTASSPRPRRRPPGSREPMLTLVRDLGLERDPPLRHAPARRPAWERLGGARGPGALRGDGLRARCSRRTGIRRGGRRVDSRAAAAGRPARAGRAREPAARRDAEGRQQAEPEPARGDAAAAARRARQGRGERRRRATRRVRDFLARARVRAESLVAAGRLRAVALRPRLAARPGRPARGDGPASARAPRFATACPWPGVDGTLEGPHAGGRAAEGRIHAKTGTLRHVNALAGYATTRGGERLAFAIVVNHHTLPAARGRGARSTRSRRAGRQ